jgi:manganese/zinc/iron transport system permease protein
MEWSFLDTWIVITGMLSAMACALPGNYLVLRRMSMMGDAISHAVLPGLALAFIITGSRGSMAMLLGAAAIGILTALLIQGVTKLSGLDQGASMGVIFTTLFALGLILIRQAADHVDLDPGCVLYGAIELTPLDTRSLFGVEIPQAAITTGAMLLINILFVLAFYKELKVTSFDPSLATTLGINANFMHYLLMTLVAATTVAAFESVGSILVIAMLIVPGATAHLLTDRLSHMLVISMAVAALAALLGHVGAITIPTWFGFTDTSTAGMMAVAVGGIFLAAFLLAPRHGVLSRLLHQARLSLQITRDDLLGLLYRYQELAPADAVPINDADLREAMPAGYAVRMASWQLLRRQQIMHHKGGFSLTASGKTAAKELVRSHRLWEAYLCDKKGFCAADVHFTAHQLEHFTDRDMRQQLEEEAGHPATDPHHREIPT